MNKIHLGLIKLINKVIRYILLTVIETKDNNNRQILYLYHHRMICMIKREIWEI